MKTLFVAFVALVVIVGVLAGIREWRKYKVRKRIAARIKQITAPYQPRVCATDITHKKRRMVDPSMHLTEGSIRSYSVKRT